MSDWTRSKEKKIGQNYFTIEIGHKVYTIGEVSQIVSNNLFKQMKTCVYVSELADWIHDSSSIGREVFKEIKNHWKSRQLNCFKANGITR